MANNNPLGVALRVRRNCSDRIENDQIFKRKLVEYKAHLMHSGYKSNLIDRKFLKVVKKKRSKAIANKEVDVKCGSRKYNYVTDLDTGFPNMSTIWSCLPTLHEDPQCKELFPKKAFRASYRRGHANLKELIAPSKIDNHKPNEVNANGSCNKCGKCGLSNRGRKRASGLTQCEVLQEGTKFRSNSTKETFKIRENISCRSNNIIYLVTCEKCGKQGVGSTISLFQRISNYLSHIQSKYNEGAIAAHFFEGNCNINDFRIMGIAQLRNPPTRKEEVQTKLEELEGYWRVRLNALKPFRLNIIDEFSNSTGRKGIMMEFL